MSGSNPLFRVDDVFGDDLFGDSETAELNEILTDAGDALDDADEEVDDIATDVEAAADDADEGVDDLTDDVDTAFADGIDDLDQQLDDADEQVDDIAQDVADAADDADEGFEDAVQDVEDAVDDAGNDDGAGTGGGTAVGGTGTAAGGTAGGGTAAGGAAGGGAAGGGTAGGGAAGGGTDTGGGGTVTPPAEPAPQVAAAIVLPANNSGVLGFAFATLDGNVLDVRVIASNTTPGQVHPLHLHGFTDGRTERLPTAKDDLDGDGVGETPEGEGAAFGPVIAGLTTTGEAQQFLEVSPDFPVADANGQIVFSQRYVLDQAEADDAAILDLLQDRLGGRVIELHGVNVPAGLGAGTPNEANGTAGYNPQVPVAAGQLLALPAIGEVTAALGTAEVQQALATEITAFLTALAPYTLKADGTGPVAADPFFAPAAPATAFTTGTTTVSQANTAAVSGTGANVTQSNTAVVGTTPAQGNDGSDDGVETYTALLLPTNNSGVFGAASITFEEAAGRITVDLDMAGLEANLKHATHIHGFTDDRASIIPNLQVDADRDGFLEAPEASPYIGPVLFGVTEDGSISDAALTANYEEADENGRVSVTQTYQFDLSNADQQAIFKELADRMEGRVLQVHGLTVPETNGEGTRGEVDGTAGYKPLLAVANGVILDTDAPGGAFAQALGAAVQAGLDQGEVDFSGLAAALQPQSETLIA
jgi:hypothetical protein